MITKHQQALLLHSSLKTNPMKRMIQFSDRSATLLFQGGNAQQNSTPERPKIGTDDGISNRKMNIMLIVFMIMTMLVTVLAANASPSNGDDVLKLRILLRQSMLDMDRGNYDAALQKLTVVFESDMDNANVAYLIGKCHFHGAKDYPKAAFYFERASRSVSASYSDWDLDERQAPIQSVYLMASAYEAAGEAERAAWAYEQFMAKTGEDGQIKLSTRMRTILQRSLAHNRLVASETLSEAVAIEQQ